MGALVTRENAQSLGCGLVILIHGVLLFQLYEILQVFLGGPN